DVVAGEARTEAEVLAAAPAVRALSARPAQPGDADARALAEVPSADDDGADDLVAEDQGQLGTRQLAVGDVEVGPAHAARIDAHEHLAGGGHGIGQLRLSQGHPRRVQDDRSHVVLGYDHAEQSRSAASMRARPTSPTSAPVSATDVLSSMLGLLS